MTTTTEHLRNFFASPEGAAYLREAVKASATTNAVIPPHGPTSLFGYPGVAPGLPSTLVLPTGIEDYLEQAGHVRRSQDENPLFAILTGQTASTGTEPTSGCVEQVPVPGNLKLCRQTWPFGELTMATRPIQVDRAGSLINRSEPLDLRLLHDPFANVPNPTGMSTADVFRSVVAKATLELTVDIKRRHAPLIWTGNPANTATNTGGYQEFNGFERIVNTGYADAIAGVLCSAADSLVYDRANAIVQNTAANTLERYVSMYRHVRYLADQVAITSPRWAWVMRPQKFWALVDIWPCSYLTYRCTTASPSGSSASAQVDATAAAQMRQEMLAGRYLLVDGEQVPVILDTALPELNVGGGNFQSDSYLLPLTAGAFTETGGQITYIEYFDYRGPYGMATELAKFGPDNEYGVSADGRFALFFLGGTAFCKQVMVRTRKRVICRAPFLAGRIINERYAVYQHERSWRPGTSFFEDGGVTSFMHTW